MSQMRWKGPRPLGGRLLEANSMCKLPIRSSDLCKILRCLQKEKEILEVIHKRNVFFLEARKIVGTYMGENSSASVAQRADTTNEDNKYRTLIEKLIQLDVNDWPKFQEHLKKLHSAEFYQAPSQQQVGFKVIVQTKTHVGSTTSTWTTTKSAKSPTKQLLDNSPIHPLKSIKDRLKKLVSHKTWTTF